MKKTYPLLIAAVALLLFQFGSPEAGLVFAATPYGPMRWLSFPGGGTGFTPEQFQVANPLGAGTDQNALAAAELSLAGTGTCHGQGTCTIQLTQVYTVNAAFVINASGITVQGNSGPNANPTGIIDSRTTGDTIQITGTGAGNCSTAASGVPIYNTTLKDFTVSRASGSTAGHGVNITKACYTWVTRVGVFGNYSNVYNYDSAHTMTEDLQTACDAVNGTSVAGIEYDDTDQGNNSSYSNRDSYYGQGCGNFIGFNIHGVNIEDYTIRDFEGTGGKYGMQITSTYSAGTFYGANGDGHIIAPIIEGPTAAVIQINSVYAGGLPAITITDAHLNTNAANGIGLDIENSAGIVVVGAQLPASGASGSIGLKVSGTNTGPNSFTGLNIRSYATAILLNSVSGQTITSPIITGFSTAAVGTAISFVGASNNTVIAPSITGTVTESLALDSSSNNNVISPLQFAVSTISNAGAGNQFGVLPGIFSAAGTALPSCSAGGYSSAALPGLEARVSDSTLPTIGATYSSGGSVFAHVYCNATNWVTF